MMKISEQSRMIAIFGALGTGKTALAFKILEERKGERICALNYPKPELLERFGYEKITFSDLEDIEDAIILWDEPQLSMDVPEYKRDRLLAKYCSLLRQRGNTLILVTSDTRLFSPRVEAYIDLWIVKNCDYGGTKQRSKIRRVIQANTINPEAFHLEMNEFLMSSLEQGESKQEFTLPDNWGEDISKVYRKKIIEKEVTFTKLKGGENNE